MRVFRLSDQVCIFLQGDPINVECLRLDSSFDNNYRFGNSINIILTRIQQQSNFLQTKNLTQQLGDTKIIIFLQLMPKQTKKQVKKVFQLLTTPQSNAYKQQLKKQKQVLNSGVDQKLDKLMQTNPDPNYLSIFKKDYNKNLSQHPLDVMLQNQYTYDQKAKRDRHFNMKKQAEIKQSYQFPLTANQYYGWRQPIDTFTTGYGMKHTFDQKLSTTLNAMNKGKKAPPPQ